MGETMKPPIAVRAQPGALLPCRFCGERDEIYPTYRWPGDGIPYEVDCLGCGTTVTPREGEDAISAWNRRAPIPAPEGEGERWTASDGNSLVTDDGTCGDFFLGKHRDRAVTCVNALAGISEPEKAIASAREALKAAKRFIMNGVELGYIRMPDGDTHDPAHETPGKIAEALAALGGRE